MNMIFSIALAAVCTFLPGCAGQVSYRVIPAPPAAPAMVLAPVGGALFVEPPGGGPGTRFMIRKVSIHGAGNVVRVRRGGRYPVEFELLHDCRHCGNSINQVIVGLAGEPRAQLSVWNGKQRSGGGLRVANQGTPMQVLAEDNPGPAQWVHIRFDIAIPDRPGMYEIRARYAQAYQGNLMTPEGRSIPQPLQEKVLGWWTVDRPGGPGPESTIGAVVVE